MESKPGKFPAPDIGPPPGPAFAPPLPRRVSLGVALPAAEPFTAEGMRVLAVVPGSMTAAAGIAAGDVVTAVDGMPLRSMDDLRAATRAAAEREVVTMTAVRAGEPFEGTARVVARPREHLDDHDVAHEHVTTADGVRLRTIVTRPRAPGPHPGVLFLQGIGRESLDYGSAPSAPVRRLVHGWAAAGFVTMRLEKRGVGDSEGREANFDTEVADYRVALRALAADPATGGRAVFLFGHSVGGMIAPLLAAGSAVDDRLYTTADPGAPAPPVRGIVVFGTSSARWMDCVAASTRRQLAVQGAGEDEIERALERERREGFGVRTPEYHAQLQARDLGAAWDRTTCDVLVIKGEHDMVVGEDEQRALHARARARSEGAAEVLDLDGTDHWMTRHTSLAESLQNRGRGPFDERLVHATTSWMRRRSSG